MFEIFQYDFMVRAFVAVVVVAVIAPLMGTFLVVRRLSLMAETLAHVGLLGVAIGLLMNVQPMLSATVTAVIIAIGIEKIRTGGKIFGESALSLFLSGSLALASVILSLAGGFNKNLFSYLFGSISTVTQNDLVVIILLGIVVVFTIIVIYKELFLVSFDEELARVNGVKTEVINQLLIVLAAITVALSMNVVGTLLIGALMVIPVITAMQVGKSFKQVIFISIGLSLIEVVSGLFISYYLDLATGGTIVLVALGFFLLSLFFRR